METIIFNITLTFVSVTALLMLVDYLWLRDRAPRWYEVVGAILTGLTVACVFVSAQVWIWS